MCVLLGQRRSATASTVDDDEDLSSSASVGAFIFLSAFVVWDGPYDRYAFFSVWFLRCSLYGARGDGVE